MRVSPVAHWFDTLDEVLDAAAATAIPSHNHDEGIKGAQTVAMAIFRALQHSHEAPQYINEILEECLLFSGYNLDIRRADVVNRFDETCQGTVPVALWIVSDVHQIGAYSKLDRDPRGRTITVAYLVIIDEPIAVTGQDDAVKAEWWPLSDLPHLAFDHYDIIQDAIRTYKEIEIKGIIMARCPKTAAEAFKRLDKRLSEGEKKAIRDAEDMVEFHFSLGLWIRNYWIHTGERENLESLLKDVGEPEFLIGDMASSAILDAYQKHSNSDRMVFIMSFTSLLWLFYGASTNLH